MSAEQQHTNKMAVPRQTRFKTMNGYSVRDKTDMNKYSVRQKIKMNRQSGSAGQRRPNNAIALSRPILRRSISAMSTASNHEAACS